MERNVLKEVIDLICELKGQTIELTELTVPGDVEGWDSLFQANLISAIEAKYEIRFKLKEILLWESVGDIVGCIENHLT